MKPAWLLAAGLTAASLATSGFAQQIDFDKVQIITDQMAPNLYMLSGSGGLDPSTTTPRAAGSACSRGRTAS